jgi:fatty-acyl-CoA synthase
VDGWWRSGDLGLRGTDGAIRLKGRLDNMINTGGVKVHAEEIEAALLRHPAVGQAAVVGVPDETWGRRIEAFVVLADTTLGSPEEILEDCRARGEIAGPKLPKRIHVVDALPRSPTGKLYRAGLLPKAEG